MRCAVFVDAGYLFAAGSELLTGSQQKRSVMGLNVDEAIKQLRDTADEATGQVQLLRILWYDGMVGNRPSSQQNALARANDVKLRLGTVTSRGQQKGVDSLIVTDLLDLARNQAISDAVLVSGDADIRVGVELPQRFGVRVHLIGIAPIGQPNQSVALQEEADTVKMWTSEVVDKFLSFNPDVNKKEQTSPDANASLEVDNDTSSTPDVFNLVVSKILDAMTPEVIVALSDDLDSTPQFIPSLHDGRLLAQCATELGRPLDNHEKRQLRKSFREAVKDHCSHTANIGES